MTESLTLYPAEFYHRSKLAFVAFADASPSAAIWRKVLDRAEPFPELPDGDFIVEDTTILKSPETLQHALRQFAINTGMVVDRNNESVAELWSYADSLDRELRLALDVLLRRGLDPLEALATRPLDVLFSQSEVHWIRNAERNTAVARPPRAKWRPGMDLDYSGYICAIVKVTRLCNLRCHYCSDWREGKGNIMPFPVQARLFQQLLGLSEHRVVDVIWHGGETTLLGRKRFLRLLALQRWFRRPGQVIRNVLQTNATLIDEQWVRFFKRYNYAVGISIDGPAQIHDRTRPHVSGRSTFEQVQRGLCLLRDSGIEPGILIVLTDELLALGPEALFRFLREEAITKISILVQRPGNGPANKGEAYLCRDAYIDYLLTLQKLRRADPDPWLAIRELDAALRAARGELARYCELMGNCVGAFYSIEPDGRVAHCDRYIGDDSYYLGNILQHTFDDIRSCDRSKALKAENRAAAVKQEAHCPYFVYCRGWCPYERYAAKRYEHNYDERCCGLAPLFEALRREVGAEIVAAT